MLWLSGADGLVTRNEIFDVDRDAEALARFDELTTAPAAARFAAASPRAAEKHKRRVRANAATAHAARVDAAIAARQADALPTLLADSCEVVDHITGVTYDRQGVLATWRGLLSARDPTSRNEALATFGDSLALCRLSNSASGFVGRKFDVGPYEREIIHLLEVDVQERLQRDEIFAVDRLGDAVARLYERHAEILPDGPARTRAAATARSVAAMAGPALDRLATALAPAIEAVDRRIFGTWSARGEEALLQGFRAVFELSDNVVWSDDAVLGLESDALLVRRMHSGTARASGGVYERPFLLLLIFGTDGLVTHLEWFDTDREDEALARFDELTAAPAAVRFATVPARAAEKREGRVRANGATAYAARLDAAIAARDADALLMLLADESENVDHTTGTTWDRQGGLATWRSLLRAQDP